MTEATAETFRSLGREVVDLLLDDPRFKALMREMATVALRDYEAMLRRNNVLTIMRSVAKKQAKLYVKHGKLRVYPEKSLDRDLLDAIAFNSAEIIEALEQQNEREAKNKRDGTGAASPNPGQAQAGPGPNAADANGQAARGG